MDRPDLEGRQDEKHRGATQNESLHGSLLPRGRHGGDGGASGKPRGRHRFYRRGASRAGERGLPSADSVSSSGFFAVFSSRTSLATRKS
jgi:hypothetical protein